MNALSGCIQIDIKMMMMLLLQRLTMGNFVEIWSRLNWIPQLGHHQMNWTVNIDKNSLSIFFKSLETMGDKAMVWQI